MTLYILFFFLQAYQTPELSNGDETVLEYSLFLPPNMPARDFILRVYLWVNAAEEFDAVLLFNEVREEEKINVEKNRYCFLIISTEPNG